MIGLSLNYLIKFGIAFSLTLGMYTSISNKNYIFEIKSIYLFNGYIYIFFRVLGFIGSPTHLLNYIIDHYTIVHLAENSILQVDLEVRNDSEVILKFF